MESIVPAEHVLGQVPPDGFPGVQVTSVGGRKERLEPSALHGEPDDVGRPGEGDDYDGRSVRPLPQDRDIGTRSGSSHKIPGTELPFSYAPRWLSGPLQVLRSWPRLS